MYITKKDFVLILIAVLCIVSAFAIYGLDKYNSANDRASYWYEKYNAEKQDNVKKMRNLSSIVYSAVKNDTVRDDGVGAIWFEDELYCTKDSYCAVWVSGESVRVFN